MSKPRVYSIAPYLPFAQTLAAGLREQFGKSGDALADIEIFLPTRRACRALMLALSRDAGGASLLLPRMVPLGDIDEDDLAFEDEQEPELLGSPSVPPAIALLRRQLLLTGEVSRLHGGSIGANQAAQLAAELGRLFDQAHTQRLDLSDLRTLVPDEFARHWQITLQFLLPLVERWRAMLSEEGCVDPALRRSMLLESQAALWQASPPTTPVIAAGSTGSIPASAALLAVISRLPNGCVVLPGLDQDCDDDTWAAIAVDADDPRYAVAQCHPQFGLAQLLKRLGVERDAVRPWPGLQSVSATHSQQAARRRWRFLSRAMAPAESRLWSRPPDPEDADALADVTVLQAATIEEEARSVAVILREALEHPGRTASLVTPDRGLARRVAAELKRWNISIDDSGGQPLAQTRCATFIRLLARAVAETLAPVPLLALLNHPLTAAGLPAPKLRALSRRLDMQVLRGLRPAPGLEGLERAVAALPEPGKAELRVLLAALSPAFAPLEVLHASRPQPLRDVALAHMAAAEVLATDQDMPGAVRLWDGDDGEALAQFFSELCEGTPASLTVSLQDFPGMLDVLLAGRVVRPAWGTHPRLAIWGPLEARLQGADLLVLGGLNEESWPPRAHPSPWMSRPMMQTFGLPLPERRIGLSAHDFCQAFSAGDVVLSRASRKDGVPTVPCRWLRRLQVLSHSSAWEAESANRAARYLVWQRHLDAPAPETAAPLAPPAPCPPVEARPRTLSVTQIGTWMRDPYALYARKILRLDPLDPLDAEPEPAEFGTRVHAALSRFVTEAILESEEESVARLLCYGREELGELFDRPSIRTFWWPRFSRIAEWFVAVERTRRPDVLSTAAEITGSLLVPLPGEPFRLTAKADRIDALTDGTLAIIDYKTGAPPTKVDVAAGFEPQLPLEALIAAEGGFPQGPAGIASLLSYWRLTGNDAGGAQIALTETQSLIEAAKHGLTRLIEAFDDPQTPYLAAPRPHKKLTYNDYEHLARSREWQLGEDGGE